MCKIKGIMRFVMIQKKAAICNPIRSKTTINALQTHIYTI